MTALHRLAVVALLVFSVPALPLGLDAADKESESPEETGFALAFAAKALCSCVFISGRDIEEFLDHDLTQDSAFDWWDEARVNVDTLARRVTVSLPSGLARSAIFHPFQGCTILPPRRDEVFFTPVDVSPHLPDAATTPWPMGDRLQSGPVPGEVDAAALESALDYAFDDTALAVAQNTRAIVVVYKGRIIAERYAPGYDLDSRHIGWSMGKSITSALIGILVERGLLQIDRPAPVDEWQGADDPRAKITLADLLHMSSGLDFRRLSPAVRTRENDHFYVYYGAIDVYQHSISRPLAHPPGTHWAYRNGDPLTLGKIMRQTVEAQGENYLSFPQRALFDRIGIRTMVLEPDPYGNFIMTGYDFGSARDWARFGLLHLWHGVWQGERILAEGWTEFVSTPAPADTARRYGGLFWLNRSGDFPGIPRDAYSAAGHLGQRTMIIPSRDMVVVRLGHSPDGPAFSRYFDKLVSRILESVEEPEEDFQSGGG